MKQRAKIPKRVLITRQFEQAGSFVNLLSDKGHYPYLLPMVEMCQLCPQIDDGTYEVILFTSANAVKYFAPYNNRVHGLVHIALGPKTAQAMEMFLGVSADRIPVVYNLDNVKNILNSMKLKGARILSPGAAARMELPVEEFTEFGADIITPAVYETNIAQYPNGFVDTFIGDHNIDIVTFCSPSSAKSFLTQYQGNISALDIVSIGSTTADYLNERGITSRHPSVFTVEGMVEII